MPRKNKQKKKCHKRSQNMNRQYTVKHDPEMLKLAIESMERKELSSYQAEKIYGIPRRTLVDKVKKKHEKSVGRPTRLMPEVEEELVKALIAAAEFGSPLTMLDLRIMVYKYLEKLDRLDIFSGELPGPKWAYKFLQRHVDKLSMRTTQNIKKSRAQKTSDEMRQYFHNLQQSLKGVPKANICNYDETNLADDPGKSKCIFKRGTKYPERVVNHSKGAISIMFAGTADGQLLPPYTVYKSKALWSQWVEGGPSQGRYNNTKSGWFDGTIFEDWFLTIILPWARKLSGPKVLIGDNLASHINPHIVNLCGQHNIRFVLLPANSTHLTQPLDVCVFAPLKKLWRKILLRYKTENPSQPLLNKCHFPTLLRELIEQLNEKRENVISAFASTGIFPFNPHRVLKKLPDLDPERYGVDQALIDYLKEMRAPKTAHQYSKKGTNKKFNREPGVSLSSEDFHYTVNLDLQLNVKNKTISKASNSNQRNKKGSIVVTSNIIVKPADAKQDHSAPNKLYQDNGEHSNEDLTTELISKEFISYHSSSPKKFITPSKTILDQGHLSSPKKFVTPSKIPQYSRPEKFITPNKDPFPTFSSTPAKNAHYSSLSVSPLSVVQSAGIQPDVETHVKTSRKQKKLIASLTEGAIPVKRRRFSENSSECDLDDYSVHDSSEGSNFIEDEDDNDADMDFATEVTSVEESLEDNAHVGEILIDINTFLLVKFSTPKGQKYYVGQVIELNGVKYMRVKFLRNKGNGKFAWPIVDDISEIYDTDVEKIMPNPIKKRRGIFTFDLNCLQNYIIT